MRKTATAFVLTATAAGTILATTSPATAGGVGDFLSPAFGTSCANHHTGARAEGATTHGTGAANGNLAGLPLGSALNQCGGADLPEADKLLKPCVALPVEDVRNIVALVNVGVHDILSDRQNQQCV
ncbi:hypothetical protein [Streptomyces sp. DH12]|uniref:hypothetical protein n=1 Tax=Streptomyces sp. DH12 TaxID=2857010 RepID=UPI001E49A365|nr:hypothetical protein [Streptomyces sp. DH12]